MNQNKILSVCPSRETLADRESALREAGFEVVSVLTDTQARFEIEMGQCGVLLMCFRLFPEQVQELSRLFRKYCPDGRIIFVMAEEHESPIDADVVLRDMDGLRALLTALRRPEAA
jgi:DNA-binding response OmpR family regulator